MTEKTLKGLNWLLALGLFLFPALILTVPRGTGYGALILLLASVLLLMVGFRRQAAQLSREEWLFIAAFCAYPLAAALNMLFHGYWDWSHFDKPARFLLVLPIFFAIRKFGASENIWYWGLVVGAIGAGALGYYQKWELGMVVAKGYTHKIPFGDISLMLGALAVTYLIPAERRSNRLLQVLVVLALLFGLTGSFASGTRGGWIAIPFIAWLILGAMVPRRAVRFGLYGLVILGLVGVYLGNSLVQNKVDRAVQTTQNYFQKGAVEGSAGTRFEMWRGAWMMFTEKPWLGEGKDSYGPRLDSLIADGKVDPRADYTHAHNDLLNLLAELGMLGGLALMLLYVGMLVFFARMKKTDLRLATAGLVLTFGYIDFSLTQAMLEHNISTTFLALALTILAGMLATKQRPRASSSHPTASVRSSPECSE